MALGIQWAVGLLVVFVSVLVADKMGWFRSKNHFDVNGRVILITGGSQGMGKGVAKLLASKGASVVIVARRQAVLDAALEEIKSSAKSPETQRFHSIAADVTSMAENERIFSETTEWNNGQPPDIVWAVAGVSYPMLFVESSVESMRAQMDINYFAAAYLAQVAIKAWTKPVSKTSNSQSAEKPRHLIFTSSVAICLGIAGYGAYSPTKSALRSLADQLQSEMNLYNGAREGNPSRGPQAEIKVHCIMPGTIKSPGFETEEKTKHEVTRILEKGDPAQTEDEVSLAAVKGLEAGGYLISTQYLARVLRAGAMGGSPRNGLGIVDTILSQIMAVVWLFVRPDLDDKVFKYGRKYGLPK